jgi:trigger factor
MQVNVERLSPILLEFAVEIPHQKVQAEVDRAYQRLAQQARVKGYRPGKAPRNVLEHLYGGSITSDVAQKLVNETLPEALKNNSVQPLATLSISPGKLQRTQPFSYKARFEVAPDIEEVKFEGFEIKKPSTKVTDEQINERLQALRNAHSTLRVPEPARPAQDKDVVVIDFHIEIEGKAIADATSKDYSVELGSTSLLKELEAALLGAAAGEERTAEVVFDANHPRPDFQGKTAVFHLTVKDVKERILPELDDDFAKDVGEDFETLEGLKESITKDIEREINQMVEENVAQQLVQALVAANEVMVPSSLVQKQLEVSRAEYAEQARRRGQRANFDENVRQHLLADSEMKVKAGLLMAAIARKHDIKIVDEDIEKGYQELAEQTGKNINRIRAEYRDQQKREMLIGMILEDKILTLIEEQAKITEEA